MSVLLSAPARTWTAAAGAAAPVFDAGRRRENVQLAEALTREALVNYQRTIYGAFREVADALAAHATSLEQREQQERLVESLHGAVQLSTQRYEAGLDTYLQVLDAQRNLFQGELDLAEVRLRELTAMVQVYRALGGGWSPQDVLSGARATS